MKDLFSAQADLYSKFRPTYPVELYEYILGFVPHRTLALDCATGNGQVAQSLASHFEHVFAIDISERQIGYAVKLDNVHYSISPAERTPFSDNSFELITVAQAYHWIDGRQFCREAGRIGRDGAVVAVWGYDLSYSNSIVDSLIRHWNFDILAPYWESERKHVYSHYEDLPFDFQHLPDRDFQMAVDWNLDQLIGHLKTWSALQKMIQHEGDGAFHRTVEEITSAWGADRKKRFVFHVFLRLGRVSK